MVKTTITLFLVALLFAPTVTTAQDDGGGCDLEALTADFLDHYAEAYNADERLNLVFEYLSFLITCKEEPECGNLDALYADRITKAETYDDLLLTNIDLTADLILCRSGQGHISEASLAAAWAEFDLDCLVLLADTSYVQAECTGAHDQDIAQAMYDATLIYLGVDSVFFSVILDDGEIATEYTFTGDEWLVFPPQE